MFTALRATLRRRVVLSWLILGGLFGAAGGVAHGGHIWFQHEYNYWNHGIDHLHVYMTKTNNNPSEGVVAANMYYICPGGGTLHTGEYRYTDTHVHHTFDEGVCTRVFEGHFSSPAPYLGHHDHP